MTQGFFPFDTTAYREQALKKYPDNPGLAEDYYYQLVVQSKEFRKNYPGILNAQGQMIIDPGSYDEFVRTGQNYASRFGFSVTRQQIGGLIGRGDKIENFVYRVDAAAAIRSNKDLLSKFSEYTKAAGYGSVRSAKDAFKFLTGNSDERAYTLYEEASLGAAAKAAGLNLTLSGAYQVAQKSPGFTTFEEAEKKYSEIAKQLRDAGPELGSFGVTQRELETIAFGGPNRAALAAKAEQALKQHQAELTTPQIAPQLNLKGGRPTITAPQQEAGF